LCFRNAVIKKKTNLTVEFKQYNT